MAKKEKTKKEISRVEANGVTIVKFDDGSSQIITIVNLDADETTELFPEVEETEDDEDEEEEKPKGKKASKKEEPKGKKASKKDEDEDDDDEDEDNDDDEDSNDDDEEELTGEKLSEMDFEEMEDLCDENDLETDPDDFDEDEPDALRKAIAKELGLTLPKADKKSKKGKK